MSQALKRLEKMRRNPVGDWRIEDVEMVCRAFGVDCDPPTGGGSHYTVSHQSQVDILTVVRDQPVKPVYIRKLVAYVDAVKAAAAHDQAGIQHSRGAASR